MVKVALPADPDALDEGIRAGGEVTG